MSPARFISGTSMKSMQEFERSELSRSIPKAYKIAAHPELKFLTWSILFDLRAIIATTVTSIFFNIHLCFT